LFLNLHYSQEKVKEAKVAKEEREERAQPLRKHHNHVHPKLDFR